MIRMFYLLIFMFILQKSANLNEAKTKAIINIDKVYPGDFYGFK